jgi:hypothetical protein
VIAPPFAEKVGPRCYSPRVSAWSLWMATLYPSIDDDDCAHPQSHKQRSRKHGEEAARFDDGERDPTEQCDNAETPKVADHKNWSTHVVTIAIPTLL